MSYAGSFVARLIGAVSLLLVVTLVCATTAYTQDPSGRPNPKGKKPPTKKTPPPKSEPQPITVTLTVLTDPPASMVFLNGQSRGTSSDEGKMQIDRLPLAHYSIEVRKEGFRPLTRGFQAGSDSPTLVFKLEADLEPHLKEFDSLMAAGKLVGPETPNASELLGTLTSKYGDRVEVVRMRGLLATKLAESAKPVISRTISDARGISREEIVRALDSLLNALALKADDNRVQADAAYLRGVLAVRDGQSSGVGDAGQGGAEGPAHSARGEFESALKFDEAFAAARYQLGLVQLSSGDLVGAEANLVRVTQAEPRWPWPHAALGTVYYGRAKFPEAIDMYRRAIAIDPGYAAAQAGLGLARWTKGEKDGIKDIERAVQIDPKSAIPHLNLGIVLGQSRNKRDLARAEEELKKAIQMNANNLEFPNRTAEQLLADVQKRRK